jgi:limonene-1,2-epoxide hydrolase
MLAGIPGFHAEICRSVQDGATTGTEWRWSGTRSDQQAFEVRGVTLFEVTDDQVVAGRLYMEDVEQDVTGIEQAVEALSGRRPQPAQQ